MVISEIFPATSSAACLPVSSKTIVPEVISFSITRIFEVMLSSIRPFINPEIGEANVAASERIPWISIRYCLFSSTIVT